MSVSILDIESCCRVCLITNDTNLSVFDEVQEFNMSICNLLLAYAEMTIDPNDIYPKIICDECLRELLVVAKFKEKVKQSEDALSRLIIDTDDDKTNETESNEIDTNMVILIKDELPSSNDNITDGYEEIEFLDFNGTIETSSTDQYVAMENSDDSEFVNEIIEECSFGDSDFISNVIDDDNPEIEKVASGGKKLTTKTIQQHKGPIDSKVIINFKCSHCGAGFMHSSNLKKHMTTHGAVESILPTQDEIKQEEEPDSQSKLAKVGKKNVVKPHKCEHCERAFVSRSLLLSHNRTHTGERPFPCDQCGKTFATQGGLDLHTRRHLGVKNYVCTICERRFVESSNLKVHMRTHTGERPHKCSRCHRSFARVFLLQIHQRTHTGERPFECETCHKCFAQQGDLSAHRRIHSGERPHQCPICLKGFIKSSALTSHMKRHSDKIVYEELINVPQENSCVVGI